ncbi:MAG: DUF4245 domain-containing protein [Actinobacteria bacterium]|nr:DUF4245 domain-containing protein [Actinomycetota bacterium]
MTSTDQPTGGSPTPAASTARTSTHGRGNWRSLIISMVIMTVVVFAFVALMPRPAQRERATVDVARVASQLAVERGWPLATVRTGDDWHPTSVALTADDKGVPTWQVGYHHRPGDDRYVVLAQTRPGDGVGAEQVAAWVGRQSRSGREEGTVSVAGTTWTRRTASVGDTTPRAHRSLIAQGPGAPGGLVTVLSGEVDNADLEWFAAALSLQPVSAATPSAPTGQPSPTS